MIPLSEYGVTRVSESDFVRRNKQWDEITVLATT